MREVDLRRCCVDLGAHKVVAPRRVDIENGSTFTTTRHRRSSTCHVQFESKPTERKIIGTPSLRHSPANLPPHEHSEEQNSREIRHSIPPITISFNEILKDLARWRINRQGEDQPAPAQQCRQKRRPTKHARVDDLVRAGRQWGPIVVGCVEQEGLQRERAHESDHEEQSNGARVKGWHRPIMPRDGHPTPPRDPPAQRLPRSPTPAIREQWLHSATLTAQSWIHRRC